MAAARLEEAKAIMQHPSMTLTMETCGHLFPGREPTRLPGMPSMLSD